jgi:hypothetical protein
MRRKKDDSWTAVIPEDLVFAYSARIRRLRPEIPRAAVLGSAAQLEPRSSISLVRFVLPQISKTRSQ